MIKSVFWDHFGLLQCLSSLNPHTPFLLDHSDHADSFFFLCSLCICQLSLTVTYTPERSCLRKDKVISTPSFGDSQPVISSPTSLASDEGGGSWGEPGAEGRQGTRSSMCSLFTRPSGLPHGAPCNSIQSLPISLTFRHPNWVKLLPCFTLLTYDF